MTAKELLMAARARIATPERWTQGTLARNASGQYVAPMSRDAVCWCLMGAIAAECRDEAVIDAAWVALDKASPGVVFEDFNDSHSHVEVIGLIDKAIEACDA